MKNKKMYSGMFSGLFIIAIIVGVAFDNSFAKSEKKSNNESYYEWTSIFDRVAQRIHFGYVEEISDSLFVRKAIEGGLSVLDPHTTFFDPKEYEDLMVHTEGKFGGVGIQISIRDNVLTVMTPIEGTPAERAGIHSGDKILKIDGKSTKGISSDKAVSKIKGAPGTKVVLTIQREGEEPIDYEIERAIINIKSVTYAGFLNDSVGYVRLNSFSQTATKEVAQKVDSLNATKRMKSLIFDLRSNPGGLLNQAGEISELFLKKGSLVVFTKGRGDEKEQKFFTRKDPHVSLDMPLVVLVNKASASASEIVAGAIQDLDRGIVLGDTTFGKGSVQSVFPIDATRHMKMTTAFYYTPSGRCINRPENRIRGNSDDDFDVEELDETEKAIAGEIMEEGKKSKSKDSLAADTSVYFTQNGRRVYGGGGIIPDTVVKITPHPYIVQKLYLKDAFFKFANYYYPTLEKQKIQVDTNFVISDKILNDFYAYLDSTKQDYDTFADRKYRDFKVYLGLVKDTAVDTASLNYLKISLKDSAKVEELISQFDKIMKENRDELLKSEKALIVRQLQNAFLVREFGQENGFVQRLRLKDDEQLAAALNILKDRKRYNMFLSGKNDKKTNK